MVPPQKIFRAKFYFLSDAAPLSRGSGGDCPCIYHTVVPAGLDKENHLITSIFSVLSYSHSLLNPIRYTNAIPDVTRQNQARVLLF